MRARHSLTERQSENTVEEGAERLRSSNNRDLEGRQRRDVLRTMRDVWESVAARSSGHFGTGSRSDSEQSYSACGCREAAGRDRRPLLSKWTRKHDDAGHTATESLLGMLDVQYNLRAQHGRVGCSTGRLGSFEGVDANMTPIGE